MAREISVHELDRGALEVELRHAIHYLRGLGYERCELTFGWHWGMDYPPGSPWQVMGVALAEVEAEIRKPVDAGLGWLGGDDVTIRVPQLDCELLFRHHRGIHLTFTPPSRVAEAFSSRWFGAGWAVAERECTPGTQA